MENNRKITIIFWLLVVLVTAEIVKAGYRTTTWFNQRFSMYYSK